MVRGPSATRSCVRVCVDVSGEASERPFAPPTSVRLAPRCKYVGFARRQEPTAIFDIVEVTPRAASRPACGGGVSRHWFVCLSYEREEPLLPSVK